jgi:hypothetical protein
MLKIFDDGSYETCRVWGDAAAEKRAVGKGERDVMAGGVEFSASFLGAYSYIRVGRPSSQIRKLVNYT